MRLLYKEGATLKQKIGAILILAFAIFTYIAIFSHVLINENVILPLTVVSIATSALVIIYFYRKLLDKTSILSKRIKEKGERKISFLFIYFFISPMVIYPTISIGIPSAFHMLVSEPGELVVTVEYKSNYHRSFRNGCFDIEGYKYPLNDEVCGASKDEWDSFVVGDKILLSGKKSYLGFSYNKYKKLTNQYSRSLRSG
ncbi:MAG: hypothetical protein ACYDGO_05610 [Smithellaceae bacterium]